MRKERKSMKNFKALMQKARINCMKGTKEGFDGIIVAIGLILLVVVLLLIFKNHVIDTVRNSMGTVETEVQNLTDDIATEKGNTGTSNP
jgi:hypothetical protein